MINKRIQVQHWAGKDLNVIQSYWDSPPATERSKFFVSQLKKYNFNSIYHGASLHATGPHPAMVALARGAKCIEVHFTLDKSMVALQGGYDHLCSLDKGELKQLCDFAKNIRNIK